MAEAAEPTDGRADRRDEDVLERTVAATRDLFEDPADVADLPAEVGEEGEEEGLTD